MKSPGPHRETRRTDSLPMLCAAAFAMNSPRKAPRPAPIEGGKVSGDLPGSPCIALASAIFFAVEGSIAEMTQAGEAAPGEPPRTAAQLPFWALARKGRSQGLPSPSSSRTRTDAPDQRLGRPGRSGREASRSRSPSGCFPRRPRTWEVKWAGPCSGSKEEKPTNTIRRPLTRQSRRLQGPKGRPPEGPL